MESRTDKKYQEYGTQEMCTTRGLVFTKRDSEQLEYYKK